MFIEQSTTNVNEAMEQAGHDFTVEMVPLRMPDGQEVWDKKAVIRTDTGDYLGTVGKAVNHIQPVDFYDMADNLIKSAKDAKINKTFTLSKGAVIGISFGLGIREYVSGDTVTLNFLMLTSYDSSYAIMGRAISERLFCLNQLPSSTKLFNIKNTSGNLPKLKMAVDMLGYYGSEIKTFDQKMTLLTRTSMADSKAIDWFGKLLPAPKQDSKRSHTRYDNIMAEYTRLLVGGKGADHKGCRGTAYGALNALTEYCNYHRSTRVQEGKEIDQVRFESNVLGGSSDKLMQKGFDSIVEIARTA